MPVVWTLSKNRAIQWRIERLAGSPQVSESFCSLHWNKTGKKAAVRMYSVVMHSSPQKNHGRLPSLICRAQHACSSHQNVWAGEAPETIIRRNRATSWDFVMPTSYPWTITIAQHLWKMLDTGWWCVTTLMLLFLNCLFKNAGSCPAKAARWVTKTFVEAWMFLLW